MEVQDLLYQTQTIQYSFQGVNMSIYVGTTQTSAIYNGSTLTSAVYLGDFKTWPTGVVTQTITNTGVAYSSGTYINAAGTNYGYLRGVLNTYIDGTFDSSSYITLTPTFNGSYDASIWSISGNQVHAADRELVYDANSRSVSVNGRYDSSTFGPFNIWQDHNTYSPTGTGTMIFQLNGQSGTITQDSSAKTWSANTVIQRNVIYTSGHTTTLNEYSQQYYTYTINDNYATVTYSDGTVIQPGNNASHSGATLSTVAIPANSGTSDRTMTIIARDGMYNNIYSVIAITQYGQVDWGWTWSTSNPLSIRESDTSFVLKATSTRDGSPFTITSSMISLRANGINASLRSVSTNTSTGLVTMTFDCSGNTTADTRSVYVDITQGPNTRSCRVIQAAATGAFEGINVYSTYGHWVVGTVETGLNVFGIIIARDSAITADSSVSFSNIVFQWTAPTEGATPNTYTYNNLTQVITSGTTCTVSYLGKTYYGWWLITPDFGYPGFNGRPNGEIVYVSGFGVSG